MYDESLSRTSFTLVMLAIAGSMALLLGMIGIYGVISYAVSQRRREIGIRLALGAEEPALPGMFVRQALRLAGIGVALGMAVSVALTRLLKSLLFRDQPARPADVCRGADGLGCGYGGGQLFACPAGGGSGSGRDAAGG